LPTGDLSGLTSFFGDFGGEGSFSFFGDFGGDGSFSFFGDFGGDESFGGGAAAFGLK